MKKSYLTCCVNARGSDIDDMRYNEKCREITYRTFLKHVSLEELSDITKSYYTKEFPLKNDLYVSYHKSFYKGEPCVYMVHSAIEYIFV